MEGFEKYIIDNHPDPDSLLKIGYSEFEQMCSLAEKYARDFHTKNMIA